MGRDAAREGLRATIRWRTPPARWRRAGNGHGARRLDLRPRSRDRLYMRNQLLRDSDWASMACSVELRVPLVDAWLSARLAANGFEPARSAGKAALVRQAAPELPEALWRRPKTGFYIPVAEGMRPGARGAAAGGAVAMAGATDAGGIRGRGRGHEPWSGAGDRR